MTRGRTTLTTLAVVGALVAAAGATASPASAQPTRKRIARTAPQWVGQARTTGAAPAKGRSSFRVYLAPRGGETALKQDVAAVSDPASPSYRHFLSAAQYHAKYDATSADVDTVRHWLAQNHLTVTSTEKHSRYLQVRGTNAAVSQAFSTSIKKFRHNGRSVQANTSAVSVPSNIAPLVTTVTGLDTTPHVVKHAATTKAPAPAGFRNARPCSRYYGQVQATTKADGKTPLPLYAGKRLPYAVCGYTGSQYRSAYLGGASALDGSGVSVAITDAYASPTIAKDAQRYATSHGDRSYKVGQLAQSTPDQGYTHKKACDYTGWYGEETLDVEAVHGIAPGANVLYYASRSCYDEDFLETLGRVVDDDQATLVSNSWSDLEANETADAVAAYEQVFQQGALQGIGFTFSSGDYGDEVASSGLKQVDYPSSDPYVTAVGGTSDAIGADGAFLFQTGWGTVKYNLSPDGSTWTKQGFTSGAGGGTSSLFNRPDYQVGVVPSSEGAGRAVPDVGMDADPTTGMLVGQTQQFTDGTYYDEYRIGGTSLASPLFAGMTALRQQQLNATDGLGFLNPSIYKNATTGFKDVKGKPKDAGNVRVDYANSEDPSGGLLYSVRLFDMDSSLATAAGWDDVTGVGAPTKGWLTAAQ